MDKGIGGKESAWHADAGDAGLDPTENPQRRTWQPAQYSSLEDSYMSRRSQGLQSMGSQIVKHDGATERLAKTQSLFRGVCSSLSVLNLSFFTDKARKAGLCHKDVGVTN